MPAHRFPNTKDAALALQTVNREQGGAHLTLLPYNRFDKVNDTTWWLSPDNINPAYRLGKLVAMREPFDTDELFVGFYVEKGFEEQPEKPSQLMDATWLWHSFLPALGGGPINSLCADLQMGTGLPITVAVDGDFEGQTTFDFVRFSYDAGQLATVKPANGTISSLNGSRTLKDLAGAVTQLPSSRWIWLDFHIGIAFSDDGEDPWNAEQIWNGICKPWRPWLR